MAGAPEITGDGSPVDPGSLENDTGGLESDTGGLESESTGAGAPESTRPNLDQTVEKQTKLGLFYGDKLIMRKVQDNDKGNEWYNEKVVPDKAIIRGTVVLNKPEDKIKKKMKLRVQIHKKIK